jgi:hypothetical protein
LSARETVAVETPARRATSRATTGASSEAIRAIGQAYAPCNRLQRAPWRAVVIDSGRACVEDM